MAAQISSRGLIGGYKKPVLISKIEGFEINDIILLEKEDGVISASSDRTIRIWLKRDSGQFWPSVCHSMPSPCSSLFFHQGTLQLFVGQDNGTISEFTIANDYNSLKFKKDYLAHHAKVSAIVYSSANEWLLSCSRDRHFQFNCCVTSSNFGLYEATAACTCLQYDNLSNYAFVGDMAGQINMLKLCENSVIHITCLRGHSSSIQSLSWDEDQNLLFSASFDKSVIVWDIGGRKGTAFELQGHKDRVFSVIYSPATKQLISGGYDGMLVFWDMNASRHETPEWSESDSCQECESPFFWNLRSMWTLRTVGSRQHHCRKCGKAVCSQCSPSTSAIPLMGYEYPVRVCSICMNSISEDDKSPLAIMLELKHPIIQAKLDTKRKLIITLGKDSVIKLWDLSKVLS